MILQHMVIYLVVILVLFWMLLTNLVNLQMVMLRQLQEHCLLENLMEVVIHHQLMVIFQVVVLQQK